MDQTNSLFVARIPTAEVVVYVEDASGSNISNLLLLGVGAVGAITTMGDTNYVVSNPSMDSSGVAFWRSRTSRDAIPKPVNQT